MGHDFNLTNEDFEKYNNKKNSLLKVPVSYMASDDLEVPNIESNFNPGEMKMNKKILTKVVNIKKNKKNKSNELL